MQATPLTWEQVFKFLAVRFGEDIAQDAILEYLKRNKEIQHSLRYFSVIAKHVRWANWRRKQNRIDKREGKTAQAPPPQTRQPSQLDRLILYEVWEKLGDDYRDWAIGRTIPDQPGRTAGKLKRHRERQKLLKTLG